MFEILESYNLKTNPNADIYYEMSFEESTYKYKVLETDVIYAGTYTTYKRRRINDVIVRVIKLSYDLVRNHNSGFYIYNTS